VHGRNPDLTTIADVRVLVQKRLPKAHRSRPHWFTLAETVNCADVADIEIALMLACAVEGLACRRKP
jgi:hypothetical protein